MTVVRSDERPHDSSGAPDWVEAWLFDAVQHDASLALSIELLIWPQQKRAGFHASVVQRGAPLISLVEYDVVAPKPPSIELRASGLWTDVGIQAALDHVTVDIEAFAVALDEPTDVFRGAYGVRTALGCELEWETAGDITAGPSTTSYEIPCTVHGELLIDNRTIEIDGWGWRSHRWGNPQPADRSRARGRAPDGRWLHNGADTCGDESWSQVLASAPVVDPCAGTPLWQSLVQNDAGDTVWLRRVEPG